MEFFIPHITRKIQKNRGQDDETQMFKFDVLLLSETALLEGGIKKNYLFNCSDEIIK
jgi:hypothetical protein